MTYSLKRILLPLLTLAILALAFGSGSASASTLSWSTPYVADANAEIGLGSVACPVRQDVLGQCDALTAVGQLVQFNPAEVTGTQEITALDPPTPTTDMTCVALGGGEKDARDQCTVVDTRGDEATFSGFPRSGSVRWTRVDYDTSGVGANRTLAVACPSALRCVLVDTGGHVVSFSPTNPSTHTTTTTQLNPTRNGGLVDVACPTAGQCTAISPTRAWTFGPDHPAAAHLTSIDSTPGGALALACPTGSQCTAVDGVGREVTFDPQTATSATPVALAGDPATPLHALVCPSSGQCIAASDSGALENFDPQTGLTQASTPAGDVSGAQAEVTGLACNETNLCVAATAAGAIRPFTPSSTAALPDVSIEYGGLLESVSCPVVNRCTAIDAANESAFDPQPSRYSVPSRLLISGSGPALSAVACPTTMLCSAVGGTSQVSFDPAYFNHPLNRRLAQLTRSSSLTAVRCPSSGECVAVDSGGAAVTYDPASGHVIRAAYSLERNRELTALACTSRTRCTATDNNGTAVSFDPLSGRRLATVRIDRRVGFSPPGDAAGQELDAIACRGSNLCVAVDTLGDVVSFNPATTRGASVHEVDTVDPLTGVACPTDGFCALTGADGRVFTGAPHSSRWSAQRLDQATALTGVDCPSASECVAVDSAGDAYTGR